jgi:trans-aconitate methyltransferase
MYRVPPNCAFEVDDFESPWNFSRPFDFIHGRGLEGSVQDHPKLLEQAKEHLKPGGWLELVDATVRIFSDDDTINKSPYMLEWAATLREASLKFGKPMGIAHRYKQWMIDAGFQNVKEEIKKVVPDFR